MRQVILDTADAQFSAEVTKLAQDMVAQGDPVYGASCVGVSEGSLNWSEEDLKALEIGIVGGLPADVMLAASRDLLCSRPWEARRKAASVMCGSWVSRKKPSKTSVSNASRFFARDHRGNVHTPSYVAWLGRLIPGSFGTIEQDDIGRAFVAEFIDSGWPRTGSSISKTQ